MNVIESMWTYLKNELKAFYSSSKELEEDIIFVWKNLPFDFIETLYESIPKRIQAVIDPKGGLRNY